MSNVSVVVHILAFCSSSSHKSKKKNGFYMLISTNIFFGLASSAWAVNCSEVWLIDLKQKSKIKFRFREYVVSFWCIRNTLRGRFENQILGLQVYERHNIEWFVDHEYQWNEFSYLHDCWFEKCGSWGVVNFKMFLPHIRLVFYPPTTICE